MAFKDLKKSTDDLSKLVETLTKKSETFEKDKRFYTCEVDKLTGNGSALIRFLPTVDGDDSPVVKTYAHGFKGKTNKWFIEACPTTIGQQCPVCDDNQIHWNAGEEGKKVARAHKRKLTYISNVLVLKDKANPENEGKVFLIKYGKQIHDKIIAAMNPETSDDDLEETFAPFNPFNFWEGANFLLKIITKKTGTESNLNFEQSKFMTPSALYDGDDVRLEAVYNSQYSLKEFIDPSRFKEYGELKDKFEKVLGNESTRNNVSPGRSEPEAMSGRSLTEPDFSSSDIRDEIDDILDSM